MVVACHDQELIQLPFMRQFRLDSGHLTSVPRPGAKPVSAVGHGLTSAYSFRPPHRKAFLARWTKCLRAWSNGLDDSNDKRRRRWPCLKPRQRWAKRRRSGRPPVSVRGCSTPCWWWTTRRACAAFSPGRSPAAADWWRPPSSAEEAARLVERYHFDVIVLDIALPGKSGVEWLHELRDAGFCRRRGAHHRLRRHRDRHQRAAGRRCRFHPEAVPPRPDPEFDPALLRACAARPRELRAEAPSARARRRRRPGRRERSDSRGLGADPAHRTHAEHGADRGRVRHRQGGRRPCACTV